MIDQLLHLQDLTQVYIRQPADLDVLEIADILDCDPDVSLFQKFEIYASTSELVLFLTTEEKRKALESKWPRLAKCGWHRGETVVVDVDHPSDLKLKGPEWVYCYNDQNFLVPIVVGDSRRVSCTWPFLPAAVGSTDLQQTFAPLTRAVFTFPRDKLFQVLEKYCSLMQQHPSDQISYFFTKSPQEFQEAQPAASKHVQLILQDGHDKVLKLV